MWLTKLLHKDYTQNLNGYQLKLPLNLEAIILENDSVRLLSQFVEEMNLTDLYSIYERINSLSPRTLLKIVLYSYMNGDYSSRSMELNCKRDINFMYFLEWKHALDLATLARFRRIHFAVVALEVSALAGQTSISFIEDRRSRGVVYSYLWLRLYFQFFLLINLVL